MNIESRKITAFCLPAGHYEWLRLPMGLRNAPLTFQRMINTLFAGVIGNGLIAYFDDLIVASKDLDSHLKKLLLVLQKLAQADRKVNLLNVNSLNHALSLLDMSLKELAFTLLNLKSLL